MFRFGFAFFFYTFAFTIFIVDTNRIYKKMSTNGKLSLYLINRDLVLTNDSVSPLHAVITVDPEEIKNKKVRHRHQFVSYLGLYVIKSN